MPQAYKTRVTCRCYDGPSGGSIDSPISHPTPSQYEIEYAMDEAIQRHSIGDVGLVAQTTGYYTRKQVFRVDKSVLVKHSPFFANVFSNNTLNGEEINMDTTPTILCAFLDAIQGYTACCPPIVLSGIEALRLFDKYDCNGPGARILIRDIAQKARGKGRLLAFQYACQLDDTAFACGLLASTGAEEHTNISDARPLRPNSSKWTLLDTQALSHLWFWALSSGIAAADRMLAVDGVVDRTKVDYWTIVVGDFMMRVTKYKED